ncbi:MAG: hypothetical protein Q7T03_07705 [Deltaproteobacteria bacterium]|nr:hypothetical protein [Deltaproteobacteria bacterium]
MSGEEETIRKKVQPDSGQTTIWMHYDESGQVSLELEGKEVNSVVVDVYCGFVPKESLKISFQMPVWGRTPPYPLAQCPANAPASSQVIQIDYPKEKHSTGIAVGHLFPNPKKDMVERSKEKPLALNAHRSHYFSHRNRTVGEADLGRLARTAPKEEGFLLAEGTRFGKTAAIWYELGENEKLTSAELPTSQFMLWFLRTELDSVTAISHYHYHPKNAFKGETDYFPSTVDFDYLLSFSFFVFINSKSGPLNFDPESYDSRVVTSAGVFILKPGIMRIGLDPAEVMRSREHYQYIFSKYTVPNRTELFGKTPEERGKKFAEEASTPAVKVTFIPFAKK